MFDGLQVQVSDAKGLQDLAALVARPGEERSQVLWLDLQTEYIPRFSWVDDTRLAIQMLNREQNELQLVFADATDGRAAIVEASADAFLMSGLPPGS